MSNPAEFPSRASSIRQWSVALVVAFGVLLLQIPCAILGTEFGWAGGVSVGVKTLAAGQVFGLGLGTLLLILVATVGHWSFRVHPRTSWILLGLASVILSGATVGFTMLRAAASFFLYLDP